VRSVLALLILAAVGNLPAAAADRPPGLIRIATFNCSLNRASLGALRHDLSTPDNAQARAVAEIVQRVRPDICCCRSSTTTPTAHRYATSRLTTLHSRRTARRPSGFAHSFFTESNTGQPSGFDLNNDGVVQGGEDALGFGEFPGQYAMALLSRFPIDPAKVRTFRKFLWRDMPGALLPPGWYSPEELAVLPLSSKSHWDVPVRVGKTTLHLLASHPTPPAFDGTEDRNGQAQS
jgi:hypothetical protein